jgi:hypothetical protein
LQASFSLNRDANATATKKTRRRIFTVIKYERQSRLPELHQIVKALHSFVRFAVFARISLLRQSPVKNFKYILNFYLLTPDNFSRCDLAKRQFFLMA